MVRVWRVCQCEGACGVRGVEKSVVFGSCCFVMCWRVGVRVVCVCVALRVLSAVLCHSVALCPRFLDALW